MEATAAAIAAAIRQMAKDQNLPETKLAEQALIANTTLWRSLNGARALDWDEFGRIAQALNTTRAAIVEAAETTSSAA